MQAWLVAMVVILLAALALTVYGALHDRALNRRRAEAMLGPPERQIPNLPPDAHPPAYVSEGQARRRTTSSPVATRTAEPTDLVRTEIGVGYASADFVTDPAAGEAVLDEPSVLLCDGPVDAIRELLPPLEHAIRTQRPLVVLARTFAPDVLGTLEVNAIQGKVGLLAIEADDAVRARVAEVSGATPVDATDRHSGWLDPGALGSVTRWVSTAKASRLETAP